MTATPWETVAAAVSAIQVSQALALRPMSPAAIAALTAWPSVVVTFMLAALWVTGVSLAGVLVSAGTGLAVQLASARLWRGRRDRRRTDA